MLCTIAVYCLLTVFATAQASHTNPTPVIVHIHNNTSSQGGQIHHENTLLTNNTQQTTMKASLSHITHGLGENLQAYSNSLYQWSTLNKKKILLGTLSASYIYTWYTMLRLSYALSSAHCWSSWQESTPFEQLIAQPQQQLAQSLLLAIQKAYTTVNNFDDFLSPLTFFMQDVDRELQQLKKLIQLHTWLNYLRIGWLFPAQQTLMAKAQEKCHRLIYLKNIIITWASEYKLNTYTHHQQKA